MSRQEGPPQQSEAAGPRAQAPDPSVSSSQAHGEESGPEIEDPLADMSEIDKWGLKGFSFMMRNYPDYAALVTGADLSALGFDLASTEYVPQEQILSHMLNNFQTHLKPNILSLR
jgi:CCR4-NOT transcription complex subunit 2